MARTETSELKWHIPWDSANEEAISSDTAPEQENSLVRRSSKALTRRLSSAYTHITGSMHSGQPSSGMEPTIPELDANGRRRSSTARDISARQPCGHVVDPNSAYNQLGRRTSCATQPVTPRHRRSTTPRIQNDQGTDSGTDSKVRSRRKSSAVRSAYAPVAGQSSDYSLHSRRKSSALRQPRPGVPETSGGTNESYTSPPYDKASTKKIGKMPETRTFRQPMPFQAASPAPIRSL